MNALPTNRTVTELSSDMLLTIGNAPRRTARTQRYCCTRCWSTVTQSVANATGTDAIAWPF